MSVKELKFKGLGPNSLIVREKLLDDRGDVCIDEYEIEIVNRSQGMPVARLDCNQAHLLMLWLQEHLRPYNAVMAKELWKCGCGQWHAKSYVCERISR